MSDSGKGRNPDDSERSGLSGTQSSQSSSGRVHQCGAERPGVQTDAKKKDEEFVTGVKNNTGDNSAVNPSDNQAASKHTDSSTNSDGQKNKGTYVTEMSKNFTTEQRHPQHQQKGTDKQSKPSEIPSTKKEPDLPVKDDGRKDDNRKNRLQSPEKRPDMHCDKELQSNTASAGKSAKKDSLKESFVFVGKDGNDEVELDVKMNGEEDFKILAALNDTVETFMRKIEKEKKIPVEKQRLVLSGNVLFENDTLFKSGIHKGSTIHLTVDRRNDAEIAGVESDNSLLASLPRKTETSFKPQKNKNKNEIGTNLANKSETNVHPVQEKTVTGTKTTLTELPGSSGIPQQDKKELDMKVNTTRLSDADTHYQEQLGSGMEAHATDVNHQEKKEYEHDGKTNKGKDDKGQHATPDNTLKSSFMKSYKSSTSNQTTGMTKILTEEEERGEIQKEIEGKGEALKSVDAVPNEEDTGDDVNIPNADIDDEDEDIKNADMAKKKFENNLDATDDSESKGESLSLEDVTKRGPGSHLSESNSVETISEEDQDDLTRSEPEVLFSLTAKSLTSDIDNLRKGAKLDVHLSSPLGKSELNDASKVSDTPEKYIVEDKGDNKHAVIAGSTMESPKPEAKEDTELSPYIIEKVGKRYMLHIKNHNSLKLPSQKQGSEITIHKNFILIDDDPKYEIKIINGKVQLLEITDGENEIITNYNSKDDFVSGRSDQLCQQSQLKKETEPKKVRAQTPAMQDLLNSEDDIKTDPLKPQDGPPDKSQNLSGAAAEKGKVDSEVVEELSDMFGGLQLKNDKEKKPPVPAPRYSQKENDDDLQQPPPPPPKTRQRSQEELQETKTQGNELKHKKGTQQSSLKPPPRNKKSQVQPDKMKGQDPASQTAQPLCKSVIFKAVYILKDDPQIRKEKEVEKEMTKIDYMKLKFALKSKFDDHMESDDFIENYKFKVDKDVTVVHIGTIKDISEVETNINNFIDLSVKNSENLIVKEILFPAEIRGEDIEKGVLDIKACKDNTYFEVDNEDLCVAMICHSAIYDQIEGKINKLIKGLQARSKLHSDSLEVLPVFRKKMEMDTFKESWEKEFPSVEIRKKYLSENHRLLITLTGTKQRLEDAKASLKDICSCNEFSFSDVKQSEKFTNIVEMLKEYFSKLETDKDVFIDISKEKKKIGISASSGANADTVACKLKTCIKKKEIVREKGDPSFTSGNVRKIVLDCNDRPFIHIDIANESSIMIYGLENDVETCFNDIKQSLAGDIPNLQTHSKGKENLVEQSEIVEETIIIKNAMVFNCICKHRNFRTIQEKYNIAIKTTAFVIEGARRDVELATKDIKTLEKNIEAHTVDVVIQADFKTALMEQIKGLDVDVNELKAKDDTISYDSKKVQWIFAQGHFVNIGKTCTKTGPKIVVRFEENTDNKSKDLYYHGRELVVYVPKWNDGCTKEKDLLSNRFQMCLQECIKRSFLHIDIIIGQVSWKLLKFVKQLLPELKKILQKSAPLCVCFCGNDQKICEGIYEACNGFFKGGIPLMSQEEKAVTVSIMKDNLADTKADILVNTIDKSGRFEFGAISKALLEKAGYQLQDELNKQKPIEQLKIYKTKAFLPDCKYIFHGSLNHYVGNSQRKEELKQFVLDCLTEAENCHCSSIAFPAIGAGNLGYPLDEVTAAMFDAVEQFNRLSKNERSVQEVKFVLYDPTSVQKFEKEWQKRGMNKSNVTISHTYGKISLRAEKGTLRDITQDCILYLWDRSVVYNWRGKLDQHVILNELDDTSRSRWMEKMFPEGRVTAKPFSTKAGKNLCFKDIIHVPYEDNQTAKEKAVSAGLKLALSMKKQSVGLYFENAHPFLKGGNFMSQVVSAVSDASSYAADPLDVVVFVGNNFFNKTVTFFKENTQSATPVQPSKTENVLMTVVGTQKDVVTAVDTLRVQKGVTLMEVQSPVKDVPEPVMGNPPEDMIIDRGIHEVTPDPKGTTSENRYIEPSAAFAKYVEMQNIPPECNTDVLMTKLFSSGKFPVPPPKVIYFNGSEKALLICQSEKDAEKLVLCTDLQPFLFRNVERKALHSVTKTICQDIVKKMIKDDKYSTFKEKLKLADIKIKGESPFELEAPTTFQLMYVKFLIEEIAQIELNLNFQVTSKTGKDGFSKIETVKNVPGNVYDILCSTAPFIELRKTTRALSYDKASLIFECDEELCADVLGKVTELVDELRNREWVEIHLEQKDQEKTTVDKWCDEMKETIGYECCKYIEDKGNVLVYAKKYEDIQTVKHVFSVKTGKIKPTARGRRGQASSDKDEKNTGNVAGAGNTNPDRQYESIGARCRSPNWKDDCKNVREYKTNEDISVYVYEANILDLNVDCIVNAANESMQHGGGVAFVIARAAGYKLNDECFDYIRKNGKVPVGKACTTTAGRLKYACVIHAVGPRWSDYYPKTHEKVKECETHLYQAVYNSFLEAEKRGLKSIALPAISSAIFGVPEEICVSQYAKATLDYSRKTKDQPSALTEIHFIDKNKDIVKKIDSAFHSALIARDMPNYDINKFVKSEYRTGSPGFHAEAQASASSSIYGYSTKGASQSSSYAGFDASKVEPLLYFDDKFFTYVYLLHGKEEHKLIVSQGDMLKVKANAVVVPIDNQGRGGKIAESLIARIPKLYKTDYYRTVSSKCHNARLCDVLDVPGYECGYPHILLAVYPASAKDKDINKRKHDVQKLYDNIFSACNKQPGIHAVVTTLLGADMRSAEDIKTCAEMFLQSYLKFYSKPLMKDKLRIHLVCKEDLVYHCVKEVLDMYVTSRKSELEKTLDDNDSSPPSSATDDVKPGDIVATGEGENCVICIDTITDPEKLKCGHVFCKDCIQAHFKFKQACPTCGQVCGIITGDQPEGYMNNTTERYPDCSGYEGCGRIVITYNFPPGKQEENHPSPGKFYKGITRVAYLPNNKEGRKMLEMLKIAFQRKLVFTIGNSRTTGQEGVITWNDIHHKTNPKPYSQFGYPDPGYLERVKDELAVKGVTEKDIEN